MLYLVLGVIIGVLQAILALLVLIYFKTPIRRTFDRGGAVVGRSGSIIEPENEELREWVDNIKSE